MRRCERWRFCDLSSMVAIHTSSSIALCKHAHLNQSLALSPYASDDDKLQILLKSSPIQRIDFNYLFHFRLRRSCSCCSCALNMLLSVLCIVLVIAAVVGAAIYFGVIDKDQDAETNLHNIGQQLHDGSKDLINKFKSS